ncbi:MAG: fused MFS/spermidine synthase [Myxococcota bacterium]|nr:fused MFS/spermidine synthase [Myxococcota bacterium]
MTSRNDARGDRRFHLLLLCFFLSGLAGLVYETAWTREFAFVFGTSELAVATVLAAYMAGLAAGAWAAGRLAPRVRRPVLAYGLLELGIGLAALAVPMAIHGARALYVTLFSEQGIVPGSEGMATALFYLACSFLILLVPTGLMGATLPLLARHAVRSDEELGRRIGLLYAVNTAGAVGGTVVAAFVLLPTLGLRQTIWIGAAVNGLVFLAAWALSRSTAPLHVESAGRAHAATLGPGAWILPLVFVSGLVSFSYEVMWVRLLAHVVGGSVYAFATMLASFLAGIALGSALVSRLSTPKRALPGFAWAQLLIAGLSLAAFLAIGRIPELTRALVEQGLTRRLADVGVAMATLFPAALAIGATFPLAVRALARSEADAGTASARVYAANTLGSIVGAVAAGFVLVPVLGYERTLAACAATNLVLAGLAAWRSVPRRPILMTAAAAGVVLLFAFPPPTPWRALRASALHPGEWRGRVEYLGVGRSATVLLLRSDGRWNLRTNGLPEATIDPPGTWHNRSPLARWLTALPVLARPSLRSLLVVGLGGGVALEVVPDTVGEVHVVELEPEVVAANRAVGGRRWRDPLSDPRLQLHLNDARNALLLTKRRFDAIASQPSHPWSAGASHLYTREFFELVRSRLAADGVFVQWIGFQFVDELLFRSLLATLTDVFDHVRVYNPAHGGGALFLASAAPFDLEDTVARALGAAPGDFAEIGLLLPEDVTSKLLLDEEGSRALGRGAPIIRDDRNLLQTRSPRILGRGISDGCRELCAPFDALTRSRPGFPSLALLRRVHPERMERVAAALPDPIDRAVGEALLAIGRGKPVAARRRLEKALAGSPRHVEGRAAVLRLARSRLAGGLDPGESIVLPLDPAEAAVVEGWRRRAAGDGAAALRELEPELAKVPPAHPLARPAARLRAVWRIEAGDPTLAAEAVALADLALRVDRPDPRDLLLRARACVAAGRSVEAIDTLQTLTVQIDPNEVGRALARSGSRIVQSIPREPELEQSLAALEWAFRGLRR